MDQAKNILDCVAQAQIIVYTSKIFSPYFLTSSIAYVYFYMEQLKPFAGQSVTKRTAELTSSGQWTEPASWLPAAPLLPIASLFIAMNRVSLRHSTPRTLWATTAVSFQSSSPTAGLFWFLVDTRKSSVHGLFASTPKLDAILPSQSKWKLHAYLTCKAWPLHKTTGSSLPQIYFNWLIVICVFKFENVFVISKFEM